MLLRSILVLLIAGTLANAAAAEEQEPQILEGYVFSKLTSIPLENVLVIIGYRENGSTTRARTVTDANGFYRFDATGVEEIRIAMVCTPGRRLATVPTRIEGTINLPAEWTGTLERNAYLDIPTVLGPFSKCAPPVRIVLR